MYYGLKDAPIVFIGLIKGKRLVGHLLRFASDKQKIVEQ